MVEDGRGPSLSDIAAMPDDSDWVDLLRRRILDIGFANGAQELPDVARTIFRSEHVVRNTLSGGLGNLVGPGSPNSLEEARAIESAMVRIGAMRMAEVLRRACELIANAPASEWTDEESAASLAMDGLEREFWDIGFDEPYGAVQEFIWTHRDNFRAS